MPSPFPGMNPYLEHDDAWHNFHYLFPAAAMADLERRVGPNYFVKADENVYVHELPSEGRHLLGRPDAIIGEANGHDAAAVSAGAVAVATDVQEVLLPAVDVERVPYIEIRDRRNRRLVTIIELLSPTNKKPGDDRALYLAKRATILASATHFVEIDLLRGRPRMPMSPTPSGDYGVLVSRSGERPRAVWQPIGLRQPLPAIAVPLNDGDPPVPLDLQAILHQLYDSYGFVKYMYQTEPDPPLKPEDAAWARGVLSAVGISV